MSEAEQFHREHELCLKLEDLAAAMLSGEFDLTTDFQRLSFAFASKSAKSYRAVLRLVEHGLGESALIIVRTIFEDLVNLTYIGTDAERLTKLFLDFQILEKKKYIEYWEEAGLGDDEVVEQKAIWEAEFKSEYERVLPNYPKRTYWSGKNLKEMAAVDSELARTYCMIYPYISGFAHGGSPLALASYVGQTDGVAIKSLAAPSGAELSEALAAGFGLFHRGLKLFVAASGHGGSDLEALGAQAEKVFHDNPTLPLPK